MEARGQVLWRYCNAAGECTDDANPNGSLRNIAGVCNVRGNVAGLMPHPERACEAILGSTDGRFILESMLGWLEQQAAGTRTSAAA
jgi:phosphoribosylformylglycinamidine synthase